MMRVGVDVHEVDQTRAALTAWGDRYLRRLFTEAEIDIAGGPDASPEFCAPALAECFAAKEATIKALGVARRIPSWRDIELVRPEPHRPELRLSGEAAALVTERGLHCLSVSVSRTRTMAMAVVVAT